MFTPNILPSLKGEAMKLFLIISTLIIALCPAAHAQQSGQPLHRDPSATPATPRDTAVAKCFEPYSGKDRQACIAAAIATTEPWPCGPYGCMGAK
jgi:hypothetical protein